MSKDTITEYTEELKIEKAAQFDTFTEFSETDVDDDLVMPGDNVSQFETIIDYEEPEEDLLGDMETSLTETLESAEVGEPVVVEFSEDLPGAVEEEDTSSAADNVRMLPGSDLSLADDEEEEAPEEDSPGTWKDDMDVRDFMNYIENAYRNIPRHDGGMLGCERAINYLKDLDREVSKALSLDKGHILDVGQLDGLRVNMMNDMMTLKSHIKKLQRRIREQHNKKASEGTSMKIAGSDEEFTKEATVARPQLVITPFERAISGMIVNAVVSSGKSFEDVYELLKKKYAFTDREELAVMQLVADMGYPIFKDRGSIGEPSLEIDFIKNYFA